jgi:DNA-binding protein HU-beta
MNKNELVDKIAKETGITKTMATSVVECFVTAVSSALRANGHVTLSGFGSFTTYRRKARNGRNPQTGQSIKIPSMKVVKFTAGVDLKKAVARTGHTG